MSARYLLDTNVCVDYLNGRYASVRERVQRSEPSDLCVSSVVEAELRYGADRSAHPRKNHARLDVLLAELPCLPFDARAARAFGKIRSRLDQRGEPIGPYDMQIAAHAIALGVILVTDNLREFSRVERLKLENWRA